ncbi:MAG TPA: DUF4124 domain-containing protein [Burkholderiales bacterium]|nr:DUF4124 domain-containing protein [Burkholderiales bacterium]
MHGPWALGGVILIGVLAVPAHAQVTEIYKCVDATGRPLYTSDKRDTAGKKCDLVSREVNVVPAQQIPVQKPSAARSPGSFPRESSSDRANAKERQREILEKELVTEQQLLSKAQQELAQQESVRSGDERNYVRVLERLQPYKDSVEVHQKNVEALRRELSNLNR